MAIVGALRRECYACKLKILIQIGESVACGLAKCAEKVAEVLLGVNQQVCQIVNWAHSDVVSAELAMRMTIPRVPWLQGKHFRFVKPVGLENFRVVIKIDVEDDFFVRRVSKHHNLLVFVLRPPRPVRKKRFIICTVCLMENRSLLCQSHSFL